MFEEIIRDLRLNRGLSQVELAKELFVTKQCVSNWENGNIIPSVDMLIKISKFFSFQSALTTFLDLTNGGILKQPDLAKRRLLIFSRLLMIF